MGYRGEITVDPESGVILRLTVLADLDPGNPIAQADVAVEYGPVEFGGKTYFCPVRGIALAQAPDLRTLHGAVASGGPAGPLPTLGETRLSSVAQVPRQTLLNDLVFRDYHLFRADARIVTGDEAELASHLTAPSSVKTTLAGNDASPSAAQPAEETAVESSNLAAQPAATTTAASDAPAELAAGDPPEPQSPEITVASVSGVPDAPALAQPGTDSPATLRLSARLVELPLVAFDKKRRTITNLKPEDLEIYDNGAKVELRSFVQASGAAPQLAPPAPAAPSAEADASHAFSNRALGPMKAPNFDRRGNTIVLYIDNTISFNDLSIVREQMRTFLNGLHEGERIALYVMLRGSFQILQESTSDHARVAATLANWTPSAESISIGQEQEARNRQTMDYVRHTEDLLSVNGNQELNTGANSQALDPSLRALGDSPGRDALSGLVNLAGHLGAIPGHKSLVWIASDNVLADWNNNSLNVDKGDRIIQSSVLHAQEAMNDAHVSVYPLDASRIEAGGVDASIGTRNVSINPALVPPTGCGDIYAVGGGAKPPPELIAGTDINTCQSDSRPGREKAQMQQDVRSIQGAYREIADATGGRTFRRASNIVSEFNSVVADGRATYLLSFTPATQADGKYHLITVKLPGRKDVTLRYRTGFFYREEPSTIKDRFRDAALEPEDATEIAITADPVTGSNRRTVKLAISATDLEIALKDAFWTDKLGVYVVQREVSGAKARITGQTLGLRLSPATYQKYLREGIPFDQILEASPGVGSVRIVVLDENSGRMGSITIPAVAITPKS